MWAKAPPKIVGLSVGLEATSSNLRIIISI
jgi:hypothetical protein